MNSLVLKPWRCVSTFFGSAATGAAATGFAAATGAFTSGFATATFVTGVSMAFAAAFTAILGATTCGAAAFGAAAFAAATFAGATLTAAGFSVETLVGVFEVLLGITLLLFCEDLPADVAFDGLEIAILADEVLAAGLLAATLPDAFLAAMEITK